MPEILGSPRAVEAGLLALFAQVGHEDLRGTEARDLDSSHFTRRSSPCHPATPSPTSVVSTASGAPAWTCLRGPPRLAGLARFERLVLAADHQPEESTERRAWSRGVGRGLEASPLGARHLDQRGLGTSTTEAPRPPRDLDHRRSQPAAGAAAMTAATVSSGPGPSAKVRSPVTLPAARRSSDA